MKSKLILASLALVVSALLMVTPVLAHVHPLVPFECANGPGAGNTASPQNGGNGQQFIGTGVIPLVNPGEAELPLSPVDRPSDDIPIGGPGVEPATDNCANA